MRNEISNTYMNGVRSEGSGQHKIYNNVFHNNSGVGMGPVYLECSAAVGDIDENSIFFVHNTAINSGTYHLTIANPVGQGKLILLILKRATSRPHPIQL